MRTFIINGKLWREVVAQEPVLDDQEPTPEAEQAVEDVESEPAGQWRDYLYPVILAIQQQLGLDHDTVTLLSPRFTTDFGSPDYGFSIEGHVRTDPEAALAPYGNPPYRFFASISASGELLTPIDIEGAAP